MTLQDLISEFGNVDFRDLSQRQFKQLMCDLQKVKKTEIASAKAGKDFIDILRKSREIVSANNEDNGKNYKQRVQSVFSVGEDGLYSNNLHFIFELIQNVDDCDYNDLADCKLNIHFDLENDEIILTYNEVGFTPFNVFAITGMGEAAKNIFSEDSQIGEKGIGFKSVFGIADKVWIQSGWFSFELHKEDYIIPIPIYESFEYCNGTKMTIYVPQGRVKEIYEKIKEQYFNINALFTQNPMLFLNKLSSLKFYVDAFRSMEFHVSRTGDENSKRFNIEENVKISVDLRDGSDNEIIKEISCNRYTYRAIFSKEACRARYGDSTQIGQDNGKSMILSAIVPDSKYTSEIGNGALYSFLPTQIKLTVPIVCHVPFKLNASREFVDPQENRLWFDEASKYLSILMDQVYLNYCDVVKEEIIKYVPQKNSNLFDGNYGKEKCLTEQKCFSGDHYLDLPIFYTTDGMFKPAKEVFCFKDSEDIIEPEKVYRLMGYTRQLFKAPISVRNHGIYIEENVKDKLFQKALENGDKTAEILDYLDFVKYDYSMQFSKDDQNKHIVISSEQIQTIIKHQKLLKNLQIICCNAIRSNEQIRLEIKNTGNVLKDFSDILNDQFEMSDIPKAVRQYLENCNGKCICVDDQNEVYLPCNNVFLISDKKTMPSFISFCQKIDRDDPFTTRITWREKSNELNKYVEDSSIPETEFMRVLRQIRITIKNSLDSLGHEGYNRYLEIIRESGTTKGRFMHELLQNADDCHYAQDVTPTFSLSVNGHTIITEYNETGFTRENIRSITAIGESTKKKLLDNNTTPIGEKGVGFKSIFAVASKVTIHSGDYHFSLSDKEPTIPKVEENINGTVPGTRMEIELNNNEMLSSYTEREILELCLCLRNLKKLTIDKYVVTISDAEDKRKVIIGNNEYAFKRFFHSFTITDESALNERRNNLREISPDQQIVCYVPENIVSEHSYPLYCGLPTKHKLRIPMAIDAPFALTTSREEIKTEGSVWNEIIRREMYDAIINVIDCQKKEKRENVLYLINIKQTGTNFSNDTFDNWYLNKHNIINQLSNKNIIPTLNKEIFAIPNEKTSFVYPSVVHYILNNIPHSEYENINISSIVDAAYDDHKSTLNGLGCIEADFSRVFPIISKYAESFIKADEFRNALYEYLKKTPNDYKAKIKELKIIPVYGSESNSIEYIAWKENSIFVEPNVTKSGEDYFVLNDELLSKPDCEMIFSETINKMSFDWERTRYNAKLEEKLRSGEDISSIYEFLINEYNSGKLDKYDSFTTLIGYRRSLNLIPLKNQLGNITYDNLFVCDKPSYFATDMIQSITVHDECKDLAKKLKLNQLSDIHYADIQYDKELTSDDIETLIYHSYKYFKNINEILYGFYDDGLLPNELMKKYELKYISFSSSDDGDENYEFPSVPLGNRERLISHINELWSNPRKIVSVEVLKPVKKWQNKKGDKFSPDDETARKYALDRYSPDGSNNRCFCQMCHALKLNDFIEVNDLEYEPEYDFDELKIALCLECSKRFESFRRNRFIESRYIENIKNYRIQYEGTIDIPIEGGKSLTFTAKHLAEIQEILKRHPKYRI